MSNIRKLFKKDYYIKRAHSCFENAINLVSNKEYGEAYKSFKKALNYNPKEAQYAYFCGLTSYYLNKQETLSYFQKASSLEPNNVNYKLWTGIVNYEQGELSSAKKVFLYAYATEPNNIRARNYLAKTFNQSGEYDQLINFLEKGIGYDSLTSKELFELGYAYYMLIDYDKSEKIFKNAIELDERYSTPYYFLSQTYCKMGEFELAIKILKKLSDKIPSEVNMVKEHINAIKLLKSF